MAVPPAVQPHRLTVRVTPKGGRDAVDGWTADEAGRPVLRLRVSAAPRDGAANAAVLTLVAKALKVPRSAVRIVAGETARVKRLEPRWRHRRRRRRCLGAATPRRARG